MTTSIILWLLIARFSATDCSTALTHQHNQLRDAEVMITSWNGCTVNGTIGDVTTTLFMDVANCPLHAKVPGKFRVRYDVTCGAIIEITDGPRIETPMPVSCPTPTPNAATESPDGSQGTVVTDATGAVWTFGTERQTLRNGVQVGAGAGSLYLYLARKVYVLGTDNAWYQWGGTGWIFMGARPITIPIPSASPTPTPVPSPTPAPTPKPAKGCKWWKPWQCL